MASPDTLDDIWRDGLAQLADPPPFDPGPRERVVARAQGIRRNRIVGRAVTVACVLAIIVAGAYVVARPEDRVRFATPGSLGTVQHVDITWTGNGVEVSPTHIAPGLVDVDFYGSGHEFPNVELTLPDGSRLTAGDHSDDRTGVFQADDRPEGYDMTVSVDGRPANTAHLDIAAPYVEPTGDPATVVDVTASPALRFQPDRIVVPAGIVEIRLHDAQAGQHTLAIEQLPGFAITVNEQGETTARKVELAAGEYTFYCAIPGHRGAGETGTIVVRSQ
jgi:plastocyanin